MSKLSEVLAQAKELAEAIEADVSKEGIVATAHAVVAALEAEVEKEGTAADNEVDKLADGSQADVQKSSDLAG